MRCATVPGCSASMTLPKPKWLLGRVRGPEPPIEKLPKGCALFEPRESFEPDKGAAPLHPPGPLLAVPRTRPDSIPLPPPSLPY